MRVKIALFVILIDCIIALPARGSPRLSTFETYTIRPKASSKALSGDEGFPWRSCNSDAQQNATESSTFCPGLVDYLNHLCTTETSNETAADWHKKKVELRLLPGIHAVALDSLDCLACQMDLSIIGSGTQGATTTVILATNAIGETYGLQERLKLKFLLCFSNGGTIQVNDVTFRATTNHNTESFHYIKSELNEKFELHGCRFPEATFNTPALKVAVEKKIHMFRPNVVISNCEFNYGGGFPFYSHEPAVTLSALSKDWKASTTDSLVPTVTVQQSSFVLHSPNVSCDEIRQAGGERTRKM